VQPLNERSGLDRLVEGEDEPHLGPEAVVPSADAICPGPDRDGLTKGNYDNAPPPGART
jgi:hypothetical protein